MTKTLFAALALGVAATAVPAQEVAQGAAPPAAPAAQAAARTDTKSPRIAVIDLQRISSESIIGKGYAAKIDSLENEIKTEGNKKQDELTKMEAAIKALQEELEKQLSVLSPEAADRKRQEIVKKTRERQAFLEDGQQDLQRMRERAQAQAEALNNEFQQKIKPHIDAVAKDKAIDILLTSQVALTMNRDFDVSREVITKADEAERAAKPAAGAAKPAAPPAGKPATPPSPAPKPSPSSK